MGLYYILYVSDLGIECQLELQKIGGGQNQMGEGCLRYKTGTPFRVPLMLCSSVLYALYICIKRCFKKAK